MPGTLTLYTFEDADGREYGTFTTQDYAEAKGYAAEQKLRLIANEYEWSEAVPVTGDDYTESAAAVCRVCGEVCHTAADGTHRHGTEDEPQEGDDADHPAIPATDLAAL